MLKTHSNVVNTIQEQKIQSNNLYDNQAIKIADH